MEVPIAHNSLSAQCPLFPIGYAALVSPQYLQRYPGYLDFLDRRRWKSQRWMKHSLDFMKLLTLRRYFCCVPGEINGTAHRAQFSFRVSARFSPLLCCPGFSTIPSKISRIPRFP
ncbi:hypothetical protein CEXT_293291 [Caerostris extrusa]|uniref:Uncharacterized protein n=1 Tax=Caerostris extrusa TaxID=172846 RepID=A0AAV4SNS2_CAEEX|nr:hypothetical protein CEXT_293291 [Caerostris extrusa]